MTPKRPATKRTGPAKTGAARTGSGSRPAGTRGTGASGTGSGGTGSGGTGSGGTGAGSKPSRGRGPQKSAARGRDGTTRDRSKVAREPGSLGTEERTPTLGKSSEDRRYGSASSAGNRNAKPRSEGGRAAPPRIEKKKPLPELKRVQLDAPPPSTEFRDRDGQKVTFPDSNLRRVAAQVLTEKRKAWRYRPFPFPLFTDKGHEQAFHFDFYVYDAEDSVIKLILVVPSESREVWDKIGRFKRQYPMYDYELWTPEKLHGFSGPRGKLGW